MWNMWWYTMRHINFTTDLFIYCLHHGTHHLNIFDYIALIRLLPQCDDASWFVRCFINWINQNIGVIDIIHICTDFPLLVQAESKKKWISQRHMDRRLLFKFTTCCWVYRMLDVCVPMHSACRNRVVGFFLVNILLYIYCTWLLPCIKCESLLRSVVIVSSWSVSLPHNRLRAATVL